MKKNLLISLKLSVIMLILCSVIYPLLVAAAGRIMPGSGEGVTLSSNGRVVGYERLGQKFTEDKYFQGRPSAVVYNAAGSAGSNKAPSNPDYLKLLQERIDSFLVHNQGVTKEEIPSDLITASGSGLDPHISVASAKIQVKRIARTRGLSEASVAALVRKHISQPMLGPSTVHVLKLNIDLDTLK